MPCITVNEIHVVITVNTMLLVQCITVFSCTDTDIDTLYFVYNKVLFLVLTDFYIGPLPPGAISEFPFLSSLSFVWFLGTFFLILVFSIVICFLGVSSVMKCQN